MMAKPIKTPTTSPMIRNIEASDTGPVHLYQIWIEPHVKGATPRYEDREIGAARDGTLALVASADGRKGAFKVHQDADFYAAAIGEGRASCPRLRAPGRFGWLQVARGGLKLPGGSILQAGDGAKIEKEREISFKALGDAEVLLFDLASGRRHISVHDQRSLCGRDS